MLLFETFGDFYAYCQSASKNFINTKLNPMIVRTFIKRAVWDVYNFYSPKMYVRRFSLSDPRYYASKVQKDSGLKGKGQYYYDTNTYSTSYTAKIVEIGGSMYTYEWKKNGVTNPARPYGANTRNELMGMHEAGQFNTMYKDHLKRYRIETF